MNQMKEKINPDKYIKQVESLFRSLKHMISNLSDPYEVIQVFRNNSNQQINMIQVSTTFSVSKKIIWNDGKNKQPVGKLICDEIIKYDQMTKCYYHGMFSFHFEPEPDSDIKMFRIDYKPDSGFSPALHAHAYDYEKTHLHLTYPEHVSLKLGYIDFCTILVVLSLYIKHSDRYPLFHGDDYNNIILKRRRSYDEV